MNDGNSHWALINSFVIKWWYRPFNCNQRHIFSFQIWTDPKDNLQRFWEINKVNLSPIIVTKNLHWMLDWLWRFKTNVKQKCKQIGRNDLHCNARHYMATVKNQLMQVISAVARKTVVRRWDKSISIAINASPAHCTVGKVTFTF